MNPVYEKLSAMVGEESAPKRGVDPVNQAMIRHWCEAMQDGNPLYTDEKIAKANGYASIIAPPQMVQAYSMSPQWPKSEEEPDPLGKAVKMMKDAGYYGIVATTTSQEYFEPMYPGDLIFQKVKLANVSPEKKTRLGKGHFVTAEQTYSNQNDELICIQSFTVLIFKPEI